MESNQHATCKRLVCTFQTSVCYLVPNAFSLQDHVLTSGRISSAKGSSALGSLPQHVVDATSVNSFKNRDAYWKTTGDGQ